MREAVAWMLRQSFPDLKIRFINVVDLFKLTPSTERHLQLTPLSLVGPTWPALIDWARQAMLAFDPPRADAEDLALPRCVAGADEALALIQAHHATGLRAQPPGAP
jgi:hypothetical protein